MIDLIISDGKNVQPFLAALQNRSAQVSRKVTERVQEIIEDVRLQGNEAVRRYNRLFDDCECPWEMNPVPGAEIEAARPKTDPAFYSAMEQACQNILAFHRRQLPQSFVDFQPNGVMLGQRIRPLHKVGIYVPGGTAAYPSSVLMNALPAKVAGVEELVMAVPPQKDGAANPDILAAAALAGVEKIFLMGGAQGVAALAYGTETVPKVDKIVGPGNIYVATAKKLLFGVVDIDMVAGPSEILIMADEKANPAYIAADLISQAEHDTLASAVLLTTDSGLARRVMEQLASQTAVLSRQAIIEASLKDWGAIIVCRDNDEMVDIANLMAPEHLEVLCDDPMAYLGRLDNVGSVFLGEYSPEPLGDYYAGPNHVLPTGGTARFFSPLGVDAFLKRISFTRYTRQALAQAKDDIITMAEKEGLAGHANAIRIRFDQREE